ncbi:MAG TPA: hypothetical protein VGR06_30920, partial [Actinophytocola sp.]|uniref:hypothetical protein n=1 Tax=Actinophytocola sp. TaxID=1872138 RepID=UPI002E0CB5EB|nr:hypothetical protein [Actinophytocola sp.]
RLPLDPNRRPRRAAHTRRTTVADHPGGHLGEITPLNPAAQRLAPKPANTAIDRYLTAFENGTLAPTTCGYTQTPLP